MLFRSALGIHPANTRPEEANQYIHFAAPVSGGVLAAATAGQTTEDHAVARALVYTVSQLPGALAAIGLALALVGLAPRRWPLVWAVVAWSAFARFLGGLVELPDWARDMSIIGHYLDVTGPVDWKPLAVQGAVGLAGAVVGLLAYRRRDPSKIGRASCRERV